MDVKKKNDQLEKEIIANLISFPASLGSIEGLLPPEAFLNLNHRLIYKNCINLSKANKNLSEGMVISSLEAKDSSGKDWEEIIGNLMLFVTTEDLTDILAKELVEKYVLSQGKKSFKRMIERIESGSIDATNMFDETEKELIQLMSKISNQDFYHIGDALNIIEQQAEEIVSGTEINKKASTGYQDLDSLIHGLVAEQMIVLAGRPGMGKTTLALNLINNYQFHNRDKCVLVISKEASGVELGKKLISIKAHTPLTQIEQGSWYDSEKSDDITVRSVLDAIEDLKSSKIYFEDSTSIDISKVVSNVMAFSKTHPIGLIVVDYLQLLEDRGARGKTRENEVAKVSRSLKQLAMNVKCPVLALSQLARRSEAREDKKPLMSDLRESGAIEQDADIILLMYSQNASIVQGNDEPPFGTNQQNKQKEQDGDSMDVILTEINVAKNRHGKTGSLRLLFLKHLCTFATSKAKGIN